VSKNEIRTPKDFINDQIEYANKRESNLLELKNIHLERFNQNVRNTPFITSVLFFKRRDRKLLLKNVINLKNLIHIIDYILKNSISLRPIY
jgi:hypothetical protein